MRRSNGAPALPHGTLTDSGPLFVLANRAGQPELYQRCHSTLLTLELPMVTTWSCLAEVMYLTFQRGGWLMQNVIGGLIRSKQLVLYAPAPEEREEQEERVLALMEQYQDRPMDLPDATLVALAELRGDRRIFSIDSDFYVYRLLDGSALEVLPGPQRSRR